MLISSSSTINFGSISKGDQVTKTVIIYNTGVVSVNITAINSTSADYVVAPTIFSINANSSKSISIQYTSNTVIGSMSTISITNSAGADVEIAASATVLEPIVDVDTAELDFGNLANEDELVLTKTISNTATNGSVLNVTITSSNTNFVVLTSALSIESDASANISIKFSPTTVGSKSGTIDLTTNDTTGSYSFNVVGEAVAPTFTASSLVLSFGDVAVNDTKEDSFVITNTSDVRLLISQITIDVGQYIIDSSDAIINAHQTKTFNVRFSPTTSDSIPGIITLVNNTGTNITVNCSGTGKIAPLLHVNVTSLDYGIYPLDTEQSKSIIVTNRGVIDLNVTSISFPTISDTTFSNNPTLPIAVSPNTNVTFDIRVESSDEVDFDDSFTIISDSFNGVQSVDIKGTAQSPIISLDYNELDFGTNAVSSARQLPITISNSNDVNLNVSVSIPANKPFSIQDSDESFIISGHDSRTVNVTFSLDAAGSSTAVMTITSNDIMSQTVEIDLSGSADAYNVEFSPSKIEKIEISKDIANTTTFSIFNKSSKSIELRSFHFTRTQTGSTYEITTDDLPVTVIAGGSVDLSINILASTIEKISGYLKFVADVGTVSLQYSGEVFSPTIGLVPTVINFNDTLIGSVAEGTIQISNSNLHATLHAVLTCDNSKFKFKQANNENKIISTTSELILSCVPVTPGTLIVTDTLSGIQLTQGDYTSDPTKYLVNTATGKLTFNKLLQGRIISIVYDYTVDSIAIDARPNTTQSFSVVFIPVSVGLQTGAITATTNDANTPTSTINVSGTGLSATTSIIQVGTLNKFAAKIGINTAQRAILKNTGNIKSFITGVTVAQPFTVIATEFEIDPGESYEFLINFLPVNENLITQNVIIHSNAPDVTIAVEGQGSNPEFVFPMTINCGTVASNDKSSQTISFSNTGLVDLNVNMQIQSEFFDINPKNVNIIAGGSYDFTVDFSPKEQTTYTEIINITSDDPNHLVEIINLSGTGIDKPIISTITEIQFPDTIYRTKSQRVLIVSNNGIEDLEITNVYVTENSSNFRAIFSGMQVVSPGGSTELTIEFMPINIPSKNGDIQTGKVTITNNDHNIEVNLRGFVPFKDGTWISFQLQDIIPESVKSVTQGIKNVIGPLKATLGLIKTMLSTVKIFLIDMPSALKAILMAIQALLEKFLKDLDQTGVYLLSIVPSSNYIDPNMDSTFGMGSFGKFLASIGGGSEEFKRKIIDSFDDIYDGNRPQFSDDAVVGAVIVAVDSDKVADVVKGFIALKNLFLNESYDIPQILPPTDVVTTAGKDTNNNAMVTLRWSIPETVTFSIRNVLHPTKMIDMLEGFEIYRCERQSQMYVSLDSKNSTKFNNVFRRDESADASPLDPLDVINASNFTHQLSQLGRSFVPWSTTTPINGLSYMYEDKDVEFGKNYFYVVRTVMSENVKSPLSSEVLASPRKTEPTDPVFNHQGLKKCIHYICRQNQEQSVKLLNLPNPTSKLIDITGVIQQPKTQEDTPNTIAQAGQQPIDVFTIRLPKTIVDIATVQIINNSIIARLNQNTGQDPTISMRNKTRLVLGFDMFITIENDDTIIEIRDISKIGYQEDNEIEITYFEIKNGVTYNAACNKKRSQFNATLCYNGDIQKSADRCNDYSIATCQFNNGSGCTNVSFTKRTKDVCVRNSALYNADRCIDGSMGGAVSQLDKQYRNSEHHCIATSGVCAGYASLSENSISQFPDWWSYRPLMVTPYINDLMKIINKWTERELQAIQKGSETVAEFIDLLNKKIEELEKFIDEVQKIIDWIDLIFSVNVGFYILDIGITHPKLGGINRIKQVINSAEGGPSSDSNGYTTGVVLLYGGPNSDALTSFFKILF